MSASLQGKVAVITGAGSGIGRAIAERFHAEGAKLLLADISGQEQGVAERLGNGVVALRVDVSRAGDIQAMIELALEKFGGIDILCNVAGIDGDLAPLTEISEHNFERIVDVNLLGVFFGMKAAIPRMLERGGGSIVNIASAAGLVAMPGMSAYGASKAGVIQLSKSAALEYSGRGIRVNAICPGAIDTPMIQKLRVAHPDAEKNAAAVTPIGRVGRPGEVAAAALFLASDEASFVTGVALPVDGGYVVP